MLAFYALLAPAVAAPTAAGDIPAINVQNFRPSIDAERTIWVDDARIQDRPWMARALLHYTLNPLAYALEDGTREVLVSDVLQADLQAGVRISRFRLGVDLPLYLTQAGAGGSGFGLGDIGLDGKISVFDRADMPVGLAFDGRLTFPTATVDNALGAPNTGWELAAIVDRELGERVLLAANLGIRGGPKTDLENIDLDDFLVARLAGSFAISDDAGVALEFAGEKSLSAALDNPAGFPIEWLASGYGYLGDSLLVRGGVGTGLTSGIGAPELRVVLGIGWEPRAKPEPVVIAPPPDADGDGIPDASDTCPAHAEDKDNHLDTDGCPDPDNDGDGILDAADACVDVAEDKDDVKDTDGCPEPEVKVSIRLLDAAAGTVLPVGRTIVKAPAGELSGSAERTVELAPGTYEVVGTAVNFESATVPFTVVADTALAVDVKVTPKKNAKIVVTRDRIDLREKVYFDTAKATIQARSYPLLDQVAEVMTGFPEIQLLRVEGHTDVRGNDAYNMDLSQRRADSVMAYLVGKGIAPERIVAKGFGETKPLDPAANTAAYEKNRRVDVFIERWVEVAAPGAEPAKVEPAKTEPAKVEPAKVEPAKTEPAKTEPPK